MLVKAPLRIKLFPPLSHPSPFYADNTVQVVDTYLAWVHNLPRLSAIEVVCCLVACCLSKTCS